jgi:LrgB-like family
MVLTAWSVRGLMLLLGGPKTSPVNRIDDVPQEESIPLNEISSMRDADRSPDIQSDAGNGTTISPPARAAEAARIRGPGVDLPFSNPSSTTNLLDEYIRTTPMPLTRPQKITSIITGNLDGITWGLLWAIGFIIYMTTSYAMPAQLPLNVLTFFLAMLIPEGTRRFIHPIFPCAGLTIFGVFVLAAIKGQSLDQGSIVISLRLTAGLEQYKTGTPYIRYYFGPKNDLPPPGAGDLLAAVLDVSIVSLAIPMFNYRGELRRHVRFLVFEAKCSTLLSFSLR